MVDGERIVESDNKYVISYTFLSLILLQGCSKGGIYIDGRSYVIFWIL